MAVVQHKVGFQTAAIPHGEKGSWCHEVGTQAQRTLIQWPRPGMTSAVTAERTSFDPLGAGALLLAVLVVCVGLGALVGWAAGSVGIGIAIGSVIGIPASIFAVYRTYRSSF